ncbi:MAG: tRNA dihydrouridine(20/20a) synthase DusA [Sneathiella sp.]|jgi:tRNA-dihydrouridine synthase A|uniref:tRNA dihydrouridine(20/20a) synthase DusA n=1 Tax=Sneathiella sp. TaxID=1964365 RepID=UPI000C5F1102|nr:tRNA dihydrouridine(20/20a) synthase DusA [Sneathiella sp.]MAL78367.1 tRNA dihydrouridine(20/20a) synthase DusA [Sneathiella sp.]
MKPELDRTISIAPMMDWTDRHDRYFLRLITKRALLYTEMVTTGAILFGDADRFLRFDPAEQPLALQLGGSDPDALAKCCKIAESYDYQEINLNVGCPSDRVQNGRFGACLMAEPETVAAAVSAMQDATSLPVTVKTRIGIDDLDSYDYFADFIGRIAETGVSTFIVHARKAWLTGLSPKENRTIPPLDYDRVYRLKTEFSDLEIIINGGITSHDEIEAHLARVDGVMVGREAYQNPYFLAEIDQRYYGVDDETPERREIVEQMLPYVAREMAAGVPLNSITRHMLGLFQGRPGARAWRRHLSENAHKKDAEIHILTDAATRSR